MPAVATELSGEDTCSWARGLQVDIVVFQNSERATSKISM